MKKLTFSGLISLSVSLSPSAYCQDITVPIVGIPITDTSNDKGLQLKALSESGSKLFIGGAFAEIAAAASEVSKANSITCPINKAGLTDGWNMFTYSIDRNAAAQLNLYAKADVSISDRIVLYHFMFYKDITDNGEIVGRCGSGVSLALKISNFKADMSLDLPILAANAQLGQATISYKLGTFGISGRPIDEAAPPASQVGKFDTQSYAALMTAIDKVQSAGTAGTGVTFTPRLVQVIQEDGASGESLSRVTLIQTVAIGSVARGDKCSSAKAAVPNRNAETDAIVERTYKAIMRSSACSTFDSGPNNSEKSKAMADLLSFNIKVQ